MFCFKIKEQFLHLDPDLDPAAQINADSCVRYLDMDSDPQPCFLSVLRIRNLVLFPGSRSGMKKKLDPESRIQDEHPGTYFLRTIKIFLMQIRIRGPETFQPWIRDKKAGSGDPEYTFPDPQHCFLIQRF